MKDLSLFCLLILTSRRSSHMFFVWDGNHKLQVWLPYINYLHNDEPSWHISIDSIILDTFHGLIELFIAMMYDALPSPGVNPLEGSPM
jgi:hypothetical protein